MTVYVLVMILWLGEEKNWYSSEMEFAELTQCEAAADRLQIQQDLTGFPYCETRKINRP